MYSNFEESDGSEFTEVSNKFADEEVSKVISGECERPDPNFVECPVAYINKFSLFVDSNVVFAKKQFNMDILMFQSK